ncbi:MAG: GMC family oxidoreductase [Fimbriimonas sp.]
MRQWDAIVVGSGAGGGVAAWVLAQAGLRVLVLERGDWVARDPISRDHVRNHRLALHGLNHGGPEDRRVTVDRNGNESVVGPLDGGYQNNAMGVGGGTAVYGAQAWRFHPDDFRMASRYGVPEGSSLSDWPFGYDELAPWYERTEWELGVCGGPAAPQMPARSDYPIPAFPDGPRTTKLRAAAEKLGWATQAVPLAINSVPRDGREACTRCQHCVGFACPVDAKNGSQNTFLARAIATGRCELRTNTQVTKLLAEGNRITGVVAGDRIEAEYVVVACGAIETARLLLASGIGGDQVGRNLQGHSYVSVTGTFEEPIQDLLGPGPSVATLDFVHGNTDVIGGAMLADEFVVLPAIYAKRQMPPDAPKWGQPWLDALRHGYLRTAQIAGPIHEIPNPDARVTLESTRRDTAGMPLARLSGVVHDETIRAHQSVTKRGIEWLESAGANRIWANPAGKWLSAGQHQAGTCRMGEDPATSVCDPWGRVHGFANLVLADGSVHVTNGAFNPFLTIMACAYRNVSALVASF